jgi:hypothetical protein
VCGIRIMAETAPSSRKFPLASAPKATEANGGEATRNLNPLPDSWLR